MGEDMYFQELCELSISWNGYEREHAIKKILLLQDPRGIPILIHRTNDWVLPVQQAAQNALLQFLDWYPQLFVAYLPEIYQLQKKRRRNHTELVSTVITKLVSNHVSELISAINSKNSQLAVIALDLCTKHKVIHFRELINYVLKNPQLRNSRHLLKLTTQLNDESFEELADSLMAVNFRPLKNTVIKRLYQINPQRTFTLANELMLSNDDRIRKIGRAHLLLTDASTEEFYQNILRSPLTSQRQKIVATGELVFLLGQAALPLLMTQLKNSAPKIRSFALQHLVKILNEEAKPYLMIGLQDETPSVIRTAASLCFKNRILLSQDELLSMVTMQRTIHTLNGALLVSKVNGQWQRLIICLKLLEVYEKEPKLQERINSEISIGYGLVPNNLFGELEKLVESNRSRLKHYAHLRFLLNNNR